MKGRAPKSHVYIVQRSDQGPRYVPTAAKEAMKRRMNRQLSCHSHLTTRLDGRKS